MKKNYKKLIVFVAIFVIGFMFAILYLAWPLMTGSTHILKPRPVDPFDILRGQYITINYDISTVPNTIKLDEKDVGKIIYVSLEKDKDGISKASGISLTKPMGDFIKGKIEEVDNEVFISYGIESFFFERDANIPMRDLRVEVKISSSGQARISNLLQNGEPIEIKYKEIAITS